eukprot:PhM_4_TR3375/c0_g1_i1/m.90646
MAASSTSAKHSTRLRGTLFMRLWHWKAPPDFIQCVFNVMIGHQVRVRTPDGLLSEPINVGLGVLQGDTLAPFLFILVIDKVLRCLDDKDGILISQRAPYMTQRQRSMQCTVTERRLTALAYADDVLLLAHDSKSLQRLFDQFESAAQVFAALVEPIFTYGLHLWPSSIQRINAMHSAYSRMLRYALGLPPAIASQQRSTESLYDGMPYLPAIM